LIVSNPYGGQAPSAIELATKADQHTRQVYNHQAEAFVMVAITWQELSPMVIRTLSVESDPL